MAGGVVMSPSPIIEVVMSPSPIIGVVEHPAMAGGVISPIITGVVEHPAMAVDMVGGIISLSPISEWRTKNHLYKCRYKYKYWRYCHCQQ